MRYLTTIALLAVVVSLAGCAKKASTPNTSNSNQPTVQQPMPVIPTSTRNTATVLVTINNFQFVPQIINAKIGDTVKWINQDATTHTVVGGDLNSPQIAPGGTYEFTLTKAGTIDYACSIHPTMHGQVVVR